MTSVRARLSSNMRVDELHHDVLTAMNKALDAADPGNAIRKHVKLDGKF